MSEWCDSGAQQLKAHYNVMLEVHLPQRDRATLNVIIFGGTNQGPLIAQCVA